MDNDGTLPCNLSPLAKAWQDEAEKNEKLIDPCGGRPDSARRAESLRADYAGRVPVSSEVVEEAKGKMEEAQAAAAVSNKVDEAKDPEKHDDSSKQEPEDQSKRDEPEDPSKGDEPEDPGKGDEPEDPSKGDEPEDPSKRDEPEDPSKRDEPEDPSKRDEPEDPSKRDEPEDPSKRDDPEDPSKREEPEDPRDEESEKSRTEDPTQGQGDQKRARAKVGDLFHEVDEVRRLQQMSEAERLREQGPKRGRPRKNDKPAEPKQKQKQTKAEAAAEKKRQKQEQQKREEEEQAKKQQEQNKKKKKQTAKQKQDERDAEEKEMQEEKTKKQDPKKKTAQRKRKGAQVEEQQKGDGSDEPTVNESSKKKPKTVEKETPPEPKTSASSTKRKEPEPPEAQQEPENTQKKSFARRFRPARPPACDAWDGIKAAFNRCIRDKVTSVSTMEARARFFRASLFFLCCSMLFDGQYYGELNLCRRGRILEPLQAEGKGQCDASHLPRVLLLRLRGLILATGKCAGQLGRIVLSSSELRQPHFRGHGDLSIFSEPGLASLPFNSSNLWGMLA